MRKLNLEGVTPNTIARAIFLFITLLNMILKAFNMIPFDISEDAIYEVVSALAVVIAAIVGFWKNNSFTEEAQVADKTMKKAKKEGLE